MLCNSRIIVITFKDGDDKSRKREEILTEIKSCQDAIEKFRSMNLDQTEFACLRAIILFKTDSSDSTTRNLRESQFITALQDQAQLTLNKYISVTHSSQPFRFGKLLLLLPLLKTVKARTIEELFFRKTIGETPIERIICDMYKANL